MSQAGMCRAKFLNIENKKNEDLAGNIFFCRIMPFTVHSMNSGKSEKKKHGIAFKVSQNLHHFSPDEGGFVREPGKEGGRTTSSGRAF
jgi:hypothetical protein